jgi:hypothetical protein
MKKYFLGLSAVVCAIAFSAFTKPFTTATFKLLTDPQSANIVNDDAQWSEAGLQYGICSASPTDIACKILLNDTRSTYFHVVSGNRVLNTFSYANSQTPKVDYLEITEATGKEVSPGVFDRIISSIQPKQFNTGTQTYDNVSLGTDLSLSNGRD